MTRGRLKRFTMTTFSSRTLSVPSTIGPERARRVQRGWITHPSPIEMSPRMSQSARIRHFDPILNESLLCDRGYEGEAVKGGHDDATREGVQERRTSRRAWCGSR